MGDLIDLFTKQVTPEHDEGVVVMDEAEGEPDFVEAFIGTYLGSFLNAVRGIEEAETKVTLVAFMEEVRELVAAWPADTSS